MGRFWQQRERRGGALAGFPLYSPEITPPIPRQEFGFRREECTKFQPRYADQGDCVLIKPSWAKAVAPAPFRLRRLSSAPSSIERTHLPRSGSLIPPNRTYIQHRNIYDDQCKAAGLSRMHGLRHAYAQKRYETLTGWKAPAAGGPSTRSLSPEQRIEDRRARQIISRELGHERLGITAIYLGR